MKFFMILFSCLLFLLCCIYLMRVPNTVGQMGKQAERSLSYLGIVDTVSLCSAPSLAQGATSRFLLSGPDLISTYHISHISIVFSYPRNRTSSFLPLPLLFQFYPYAYSSFGSFLCLTPYTRFINGTTGTGQNITMAQTGKYNNDVLPTLCAAPLQYVADGEEEIFVDEDKKRWDAGVRSSGRDPKVREERKWGMCVWVRGDILFCLMAMEVAVVFDGCW